MARFLCILLLCVAGTVIAADIGEIIALNELYANCGGTRWYRKDNWLKEDPCTKQWYGVGCTNGHVTSLSLDNNNLRGPLSESLPNLIYLKRLELHNNELVGPLPRSIGNFFSLQRAYLFNNNLNGTFPEGIGNLRSLTSLRAQNNDFEGPLPETFGNMQSLSYLEISYNRITGPLPASFSKLTSLQSIYVQGNYLSGPLPEFDDLNKTVKFYFYDNEIDGSIPASIEGMTSLELLNGAYNRLSGSLPTTIINLEKLEELELQLNGISGELPPNMKLMKSLTKFDIRFNLLSGLIPDDFGNIPYLKEFLCGGNLLESPLPKFLQTKPRTLKAGMRYNNFTCPLPPWCDEYPTGEGQCAPCYEADKQLLCCSYYVDGSPDQISKLCTLQPGCPDVDGWTKIEGVPIKDCIECQIVGKRSSDVRRKSKRSSVVGVQQRGSITL